MLFKSFLFSVASKASDSSPSRIFSSILSARRIAPLVSNAKAELESGVSLAKVLESIKPLCRPSDFPSIEEELKKVCETVEPMEEEIEEKPADPYEELYNTLFDPLLKQRVNEKDETWKLREQFAEKLLSDDVDIDQSMTMYFLQQFLGLGFFAENTRSS